MPQGAARRIGPRRRLVVDVAATANLIGAIVRNGTAIFPHGEDVLEAGDRVIVFTESADAARVVEAL